MRLPLALLLTLPLLAQQPDKPAAPDAQAPAKTEQKAEASPVPDTENWLTGSIDLGYRFRTDVRGNYQQYRSVVNQFEGLRLFNLDFTLQDPKKRLFDRVDVRAFNWGGEPYNTAHLDARKSGIYELNVDYRNIAYFNAVPSYANPFSPGGFNERAFDVHQRTGSADLTLFPGRHIVPYLGFWRNGTSGDGIETWVLGSSNEFAVPTRLRDSTNNYRGGVRFEFDKFHVTLEQGGSTFRNDDSVYTSGLNAGDRTTPVLGQTTALTGLAQAYGIRGNTIYTKALATASPVRWLNLNGQFLFSEPRTDVHFNELAVGNFVSVTSLLFFSGLRTAGFGTANAPHVSGNAGFELRPGHRLRVVESWMTDRYHDSASPLITQVMTAGATAQELLNASQAVNFNQNQVDVLFDVLPRLTLRGGWRHVWGDASVQAGPLSQIGPLARGELRRNVGIAGLNFRISQKLAANLEYEGSSSDRVYFRTSLNNYHRARARARYQATQSLAFQANFMVLDNQNPGADIRFDYRMRTNSFALFWTPAATRRITFTGEYDRSTLRSDISYLLPQFLSPALSSYRDNAHTATSLVEVALPGYAGLSPKLSAGGSLFISHGSRSTRYYQPIVRFLLPLTKHVSWNTEWDWYGYREESFLFEGFRTHVFNTGIRLTR